MPAKPKPEPPLPTDPLQVTYITGGMDEHTITFHFIDANGKRWHALVDCRALVPMDDSARP